MSISAISYGIASFVYALFFLVLLTDKHKGRRKIFLLIAAFLSAVWALLIAYESGSAVYPPYVDIISILKSCAWLVFIGNMLYEIHDAAFDDARTAVLGRFRLIILTAVTVLIVLFVIINFDLVEKKSSAQASIHLFLSVMGIVMIEQLYRNVSVGQRWIIKYLCLGLLGGFIFEFYMYSDALLYQRIDLILWEVRGFVLAILVPLIALSVLRDPLWSPEIYVSRRIIFHTTTLLASAVYLFIMGLAGYYVKKFGGHWGTVLQALLLFATILLLAVFLASRRIRASTRVFLNKHFYPYKYDYREEWLRLIKTISLSTENLWQESIQSLAQIISSESGQLWINTGHGFYECCAGMNMECSENRIPSRSSLPIFMHNNEFVINVDEYHNQPEMYQRLGNLELPECVSDDVWLIVPLIHIDTLIGFIMLTHSIERRSDFNWEDSDLLKTAARQVASYISQHKISVALAEAQQFEQFNKISTYIVHDMKNLVTQLSLITANADKHKNNPLFMLDVVKTIDNTVKKMNKMLNIVAGKEKTEVKKNDFDLIELLGELIDTCLQARSLPTPQLECMSNSAIVHADRNQLMSIFNHLVQNAQDATPDDGEIRIVQSLVDDSDVEIRFIDNGSGMSESFIREQLFRPFRSTKRKGMGIGVYETREIISALGGSIEVQSKLGAGTTFTVRLPLSNIPG